MKRILCALILFSSANVEDAPAPVNEVLSALSEKVVYLTASAALGSVSLLAHAGAKLSQLISSESFTKSEYLLFKDLSESATKHAFSQILNRKKVSPSELSWKSNHKVLSQIPAAAAEDKKLLEFLDNRWLAKSTGFFSSLVNWVYPCFGVSIQVNPESTSHYARNPRNKISEIYQKKVDLWKKNLPHPQHFPLILTRPCDLKDYLPSYHFVAAGEEIEEVVQKLPTKRSKVVLDLTKSEPARNWTAYQKKLVEACKKHQINLNKIVCIEQVQQDNLGGLRLLPLDNASSSKIERDHRFLLNWVSTFGLTANRLELDRCLFAANDVMSTTITSTRPSPSKEAVLSHLAAFTQKWNSNHPQKSLMVNGTIQALQGLMIRITDEKWSEITKCPTRSQIVTLSFQKIQEDLELIANEKEDELFFNTASRLEQIHASLSSLLEVFSPYEPLDFHPIHHNVLTVLPSSLSAITSCGIHASGMTSIAGVFKAVQRALNRPPRVLYGENTYFECIHMAEEIADASSILEAKEEDWKEVDLLIAQFNPALKRIDLEPTEYHVENIAQTVRLALNARHEKSLTLAIDCTLDYINSSRVKDLLNEFQEEILLGRLNVICFRSGLKFDLFGMDNYCGAPFFMIHNNDPKWSSFNTLLTEPVLQTDRLSLNWFCLAYEFAAPYLELYRKQIFDNTCTLLSKIPSRLFDNQSKYRVVYCDRGADASFLDIKISGPHHQLKGAVLVGGCLSLKSMEEGHPIFYRPSLGFYHPNFTMLFSKENTTIRLTLGLDPSQVDVFTHCFELIDALNEKPDYKMPALALESL